jgi:hypothetical protein
VTNPIRHHPDGVTTRRAPGAQPPSHSQTTTIVATETGKAWLTLGLLELGVTRGGYGRDRFAAGPELPDVTRGFRPAAAPDPVPAEKDGGRSVCPVAQPDGEEPSVKSSRPPLAMRASGSQLAP